MREILFKAKDWLGYWHIGSIVHKVCENNTTTSYYANSGMCNHIIQAGDYYIIDESGEGFWTSPSTIGEYTGLVDKNGVKIFEGDVVNYNNGLVSEIFKVVYNEKYARFTFTKPNTVFAVFDTEKCEVVGNVHDNPELMEGGEQE